MKALSWLGAACVTLGMLVTGPALAQPKKPAPTKGAAAKPDTKKDAKGDSKKDPKADVKPDATPKEETPHDKAAPYLKEGAKAYAAGEWDDAHAEYTIAYSIEKSWETAGGLGKAAYKTQHFAQALLRLGDYLRDAPSGKISAKEKTEIEGWVQECKSKIGSVTIKGPAGDILIDGEDAGKAPTTEAIPLDPGKHKVEVRMGAQGETRMVDISAGATTDLDFTPKAVEKTVILKPEDVLPPAVRTGVVLGGGALALGGIAAGGVMLGLSFAKNDELQKAQADSLGRDAAKLAAQGKADAMSTAIWCFGGGGLAAIGTAVFYIVTRPKVSTPPPIKAGVFVSPQGSGAVITGQF
ncbi:MAG: hypothetical protein U0441_12465 [Polyangiaceae bacterium]